MGHQPLDESQRTTGIGPISTLALREPISTGGLSWNGNRTKCDNDRSDGPFDGTTYILRGPDNKPLRAYFEQGCSWSWKKDWIWRDGVALASVDASGTRFHHVDHLGTPRRITNASGALVSTHDYYPFGEQVQTASDGEVMKFTGHERDFSDPTRTDDDLDYMHARYHNPTIARFLSVDSIGGTPGAPQSWNRYSYVRNNPLALVDPDGETALAVLAIRAGFGAVGGSAASTGYYLVKSKAMGNPMTLAGTLNSAAKGAIIGGGASVPGIGAPVAAFAYDFAEQQLGGATTPDAAEHAGVVALGALGGSAFGALDQGTNLLGGAGAALGANFVGDMITALGNELPEKVASPEGSAEQLSDKQQQAEELNQEEVIDPEPTPAGGYDESQ